MDKIKQYQDIIIEFLNEQAAPTLGLDPNIRREVIVDRESNNFQLLHVGWRGREYQFFVAFHLSIINDKIWLQWNRTEHEVVDFLQERGVPKEDIVLGLKPPFVRQHTGFAVT
ncbi:MAG: XisI protein [Bacteroidota bacterium]